MENLIGREVDCFITPSKKLIPPGILMDLAYQWYICLRIPIHGIQYEMIQNKEDNVIVNIANSDLITNKDMMIHIIKNQLNSIFEKELNIEVNYVEKIESRKKSRHIRYEVAKKYDLEVI